MRRSRKSRHYDSHRRNSSMPFGNSIGSRVKRIIANRIKSVQEEHDKHCAAVDAVTEKKIADAQSDAAISKEVHATQMVMKIIGTN